MSQAGSHSRTKTSHCRALCSLCSVFNTSQVDVVHWTLEEGICFELEKFRVRTEFSLCASSTLLFEDKDTYESARLTAITSAQCVDTYTQNIVSNI